ncbi:MAG: VanZ family protein [Alphaproteobacteria bacterium]|jgi:hypothetical protein|nr:VanZ family protein [Alphaproteobacteria bacterium]
MTGQAKLKILAALLLSLATQLLFGADARFKPESQDLLPNLDFNQGFRHWTGTPGGVGLRPGEPSVAMLAVRGKVTEPRIMQTLASPRDHTHIRVAADIKVQEVVPGPSLLSRAGIILRSFGDRGQRLWYRPETVALTTGTADWRRYDTVIPVADEAVVMRLFVYLGGLSGAMAVRRLTVESVSEAEWFKTARIALIVLWLAAGGWIVVPLAVFNRPSLIRVLALLVGLGILAAVLSPQPFFRQFKGTVVSAAHHVVTAAFLEREPELAQRRGGGDRGDHGETEAKRDRAPSDDREAPGPAVSIHWLEPWPAAKRLIGLQGLGHMFAYTAFAALMFQAFQDTPWRNLIVYLLIAALATEVLQIFTVTRSVTVVDGALNGIGVILGFGVHLLGRAGIARWAR